MHVANVLLILNLDHIKLSHEIAVLQVLALGQLFKALETKCFVTISFITIS